MSHARNNARRLKAAVQRVEAQPYNDAASRRAPRLAASDGYLCCRVSSTLAAATGTFPSLTAGKVTGQQVYMAVPSGSDYTLSALPSSASTIINFSGTSFATGKTTVVRRTGLADVYAVVTQDC